MKKNITNLSHIEANEYFLDQKRYVTVPLPDYFDFKDILQRVDELIQDLDFEDLLSLDDTYPSNCEDVNFRFYSNKDGAYDWRPLDIINPFLYVYLVNLITKKENWRLITEFLSTETEIDVESLPLIDEEETIEIKALVENWIKNVERRSVSLGLEYSYVTIVDVSNCYSSFYTHSIPWALHTKAEAKRRRNEKNLLGNEIDFLIRCMSNGQTNGIPQGSVVMDLIAEVLLKYLDIEICKRLEGNAISYKIIRYRDDYRIFTNNKADSLVVVKALSESLAENGLKLNSKKIAFNEDIVKESIKIDKWKRLYTNLDGAEEIEDKFLLLYDFSINHKNSGSLKYYFGYIFDYLCKNELVFSFDDAKYYISILTNITLSSPDLYPMFIFIISRIMKSLSSDEREAMFILIREKFKLIPNTIILDIWFQRICKEYEFQNSSSGSKLTQLAISQDFQELWNIDWVNEDLREVIYNNNPFDNELYMDEDFALGMDDFEHIGHTFWSYINR